MLSFLMRSSGLREVARRCKFLLDTANFSSISHALCRGSSLEFVQSMLNCLESTRTVKREELISIDGMAVTLPKTQRHNCKKFNNKTVGGGVVWTFAINCARGACPVKLLKTVQGAWHDSKVIQDVQLQPKGPVYLMDRGFYALKLLSDWLEQKVHFIVRAKKSSLKFEILETVTSPRRIGNGRMTLDAIVRIGGPRASHYPVVRLIRLEPASGEELIIATDRFKWSTIAVLRAYKKRWHIERFHRFLKDTLGFAHLYSFHQTGIMFLLHACLLTAIMLWMNCKAAQGETIDLLQAALKEAQRELGLSSPWKRNTCSARRKKKKKSQANL